MLSPTQPLSTQVTPVRPDAADAPLGLYIHTPFCARRCPYCDFNTYAGLGALHERTVDALCRELSVCGSRLAGRVVTSVFVGGGTPTELAGSLLSRLLEAVRTGLVLADGCEITVEANPGTVDREKFARLHDHGVNRLSMGVQSFQADELAFLGRIHDVDDVYTAYEAARAAGFDNVSLDLIFGLPGQTTGAWRDTLARAVALLPDHLSLYSLIVEQGTPLHTWVADGRVDEPDDDAAGALYEMAIEQLAATGYTQYEVSNWATSPEKECRHNLLYWRNGEYVGVGPGAHSHLRQRDENRGTFSRRWSNVRVVAEYVRRIEEGRPVEDFREELNARDSMGETMMLGLRLVREGVPFRRFRELHGVDLTDVYGRELGRLQGTGLIEVDEMGVRLTRRGLMIGNQVFVQFLTDGTEAVAA